MFNIFSKVEGLDDVYAFLHVLRFCATIKRDFHEDTQKVLDLYCKLDILPKAREVLNSAEIPYRYGNFIIKIDKNFDEGTDLNSLKLEDWLSEDGENSSEKEGEKKNTKKFKFNLFKKQKPPPKLKNLNSKLEMIKEKRGIFSRY